MLLLEVKAENATKNGVLCPACISNHEPCTANYSMACTGEERYCLTLQGKFIGSKPIMHTSGCSTFAESLCRENQPLDFLTYPDEKIPTRYTKVTSKTNLATRHFIWCRICHNCPEEYNPKAKAILCSQDEDVCVYERTRIIYGRYIVMETLHGCTTDEICEAGSILTEADDERNTFSTIKTDIRCTVSGAITWSSAIYKFLMITYTALCVLDI
ncbi:uncharacterized protein LOC120915806 [Rana temporaria]|uniref:uncharacterized protein LOC120915806 n=1 Tax=Rana temporaria TaxID=8407 RepID=UPI001AACD33B|nr:uncharacterized protein LOC120915806 [Rana temporaria]